MLTNEQRLVVRNQRARINMQIVSPFTVSTLTIVLEMKQTCIENCPEWHDTHKKHHRAPPAKA